MVIDPMDSMKTTMYAGAFLATAVMVMTLSILSDALFHTETPEQFGYEIAAAEGSAPAAVEEEATIEPITPLLASADVAAGETVFKKCASCHNVAEGGDNKIGPGLWNVIGAQPGVHAGFKYSAAMVAYGETGEPWSFESLNKFLLRPKDYIKDTSMGFAGLKKAEDRANLIAYLNQNNSNPLPLQ